MYLRFPTEQFRNFCERFVEKAMPSVNCTIAKVRYALPVQLVFEGVELKNANVATEVVYTDPEITVSPYWKNPLGVFDIQSTAYGGTHSVRMQINSEAKSIELNDLDVENLALAEIEMIRTRLNRKITGKMTMEGSLTFSRDQLQLIEAKGVVSVNDGNFELRRPILEQENMWLKTSKVKFNLQANELQLSEGELRSAKLNASFTGKVALTKPLSSAALSLQGDMEPLNPLYQEKRQLRAIVARMQKRYEQPTLPFTVGGTIDRPRFVFEKSQGQ